MLESPKPPPAERAAFQRQVKLLRPVRHAHEEVEVVAHDEEGKEVFLKMVRAYEDLLRLPSCLLYTRNRIELMLPIGLPDLKAFVDFAQTLSLNIEPNRATQSQVEILDYFKCSKSEVQTADALEGRMTAPEFEGCIDIRDDRPVAFVKQMKSTSGQAYATVPSQNHSALEKSERRWKGFQRPRR